MKTSELKPLLDLCSQVEETTDYCVFFRYSGHVNGIEIDIAKSKTKYLEMISEYNFYLDDPQAYQKMTECINMLSEYITDKTTPKP